MKEQAPKTPRKLGDEAEKLYMEHRDNERQLVWSNRMVNNDIQDAQENHGAALAKEAGQDMYKGHSLANYSVEGFHKTRDAALKNLTASVLRQGVDADKYESNIQQAAQHYSDNPAGYHDLAVAEAALDGVHIQVQAPASHEEHIDVTVK